MQDWNPLSRGVVALPLFDCKKTMRHNSKFLLANFHFAAEILSGLFRLWRSWNFRMGGHVGGQQMKLLHF